MNKIFKTIQIKNIFNFNSIPTYNKPFGFCSFIKKTGFLISASSCNLNRKTFCTINKLDIDKLSLDKLDNQPIIINKIDEENKSFIREDHIIEFCPEIKWEETVLNSDIPVVVDCYAKWCAPCKKLMPLLEKKLDELKNFKLVKINTDENEELAGMLNITSVPTVFLVYKGNVIDSFVGFPDSQKLDNFFESINLLRGISQNEKIIRALLTGVDEFMSKKIYDRAENMLNEAYSHERWREKYAHIIKLGLAICAFHRSDFKLSEKFLKDLKMNYKNQIASDPVLNKKLALLEIRLNLNTNPELLNKETENYYEEIEKNPTDLDLRYKLSVFLFENSEYEKAVENLLEIIQIERNWKNKAAQQFLIQIFNFLGADNSLTVEGRKKLMKILY